VASAAATEEALLKLVATFPADFDNEDIQETLAACSKMPGPPGDAFEQLLGNWKVEWNSRTGRALPKDPATRTPMGLNLMSFNALPSTQVHFLGSYNRILDGRESSTQDSTSVYELIQVFTIPGSDDVEAGMVLSGPWKQGTAEGEWGQGAPRVRCGVQFETVRLALSASNTDESKAMLEAAGLAEYVKPVKVSAKATYVDIKHISPAARVHQGESGMVYVLTRMSEEVPFALD